MRKITLERLSINNFKGCTHLELSPDGRNMTIYGDNAAGKTTIYDALTWLLFGKDSLGRSDFEIKPLAPDGSIRDHAAVTSVEASINIDGARMFLCKHFYERWSTKRGGVDKSYDGNTCDYFIDGVPCKKYEFEDHVARFVDEKAFRLLTSISFFCSGLKWQERRATLFDISHVSSDAEIMSQSPRFTSLMEACGRLSVDDLKKRLAAERKGYNVEREKIPARLDECQKMVVELEGYDFPALRAEVEKRRAELAKLNAELIALENDSLLAQKRNEEANIRNQIAALENENKAYIQSHAPSVDRKALEEERRKAETALTVATGDIDKEKSLIATCEGEIEKCRADWKAVKADKFTGENCPTCGQPLTGDKLEAAKKDYDLTQATVLNGIESKSKVYKDMMAGAKDRHEKAIERAVAAENRIAQLADEIAACPSEDGVKDMPDYMRRRNDLEGSLAHVAAEILEVMQKSSSVRQATSDKVHSLEDEVKAIQESIANEAVLQRTKARMEQLMDDAKAKAEKMEEIDRLLALCDDFTRYKAQYIEESVNKMFNLVRWKLFDEQINGVVVDCCEATVNGVPYNDGLNDGAKVNAGLDVISALSAHYGVSVPLFIDNAERVTRLLDIDTQVIRLVVSEQDKKLRCEYEG